MTNQQLQQAYFQRDRQQQIYRAFVAGYGEDKNSYDVIKEIENTNGFLNYIEYSPKNIDSQKAADYLKNLRSDFSFGRCTGVYSGAAQKVLRQLDWYYNDEVEFIIKMNADSSKGIHKSIGVTAASPKLTRPLVKELITDGSYYEYFDMLPYFTVDGLNDDGIFAQSNVVIKNGVELNINDEPGKIDCCIPMLVRYILDNVDHDDLDNDCEGLIEKLNKLHIYGTVALGDYNSHILISNRNKSYVIEFTEDDFEIIRFPIMTNFRTNGDFYTRSGNMPDWTSIESFGDGVERWEIAAQFLNNRDFSDDKFKQLRETFNYSNAYKNGQNGIKDAWLTEFLTDGLTVMDAKNVHDGTASQDIVNKFKTILLNEKDKYDHRLRSDSKAEGTWHTTHSCIYDIGNSSFNIQVQEGIDEVTKQKRNFSWNVTLDGDVTQVDD